MNTDRELLEQPQEALDKEDKIEWHNHLRYQSKIEKLWFDELFEQLKQSKYSPFKDKH